MTFEVYIAGLLRYEDERAQVHRIVGDLQKQYGRSRRSISLVLSPEVGGRLPDAIVFMDGVPVLLECKNLNGSDDTFRLQLRRNANPEVTLLWDHPTQWT